jgi:hypothetical protein
MDIRRRSRHLGRTVAAGAVLIVCGLLTGAAAGNEGGHGRTAVASSAGAVFPVPPPPPPPRFPPPPPFPLPPPPPPFPPPPPPPPLSAPSNMASAVLLQVGPLQPPPEAIRACEGLVANQACTVHPPNHPGDTIAGVCAAEQSDGSLFCRPNVPPPDLP